MMPASGHRKRVIVVTEDASLLEPLRGDESLEILAHFDRAGLAKALLATSPVDAILVDEHQAAEFAGAAFPPGPGGSGPEVFVLRSMGGWGTGRPAAREGAQPVIGAAGPSGSEAAVARPATLRDWWLRGRAETQVRAALARGQSGGRAFPAPAAATPEVLMRQVIAVVSPKGGVGKTFLSVSLAVSLARYTGFRVILLDLDLHSGDAAVHLDLLGSPTLAELLPYAGALEPSHLSRAVVRHEPSHLDVLLAPAKPEAAEMMAREHLGALLRVVRQRYDFAVIDTPPDPSDPLVAECMSEATAVVLVSSLDAAALRQCRLFLDSCLGPAGTAPFALYLALNQVHEGGPLPSARAAAFLESGLGNVRAFLIPEDRAGVERAVFDGRPLVLTEPGHPASQAVFALADRFCPVFAGLMGDRRPRRGGLGRLIEAIRKW